MTDTPLQTFQAQTPTAAVVEQPVPEQAAPAPMTISDALGVISGLSSEVDAESAARQARFEAVAQLKHKLDDAKDKFTAAVQATAEVKAAWAALKAAG